MKRSAALVALFVCSAAGAPAADRIDGNVVFANARTAWAGMRYPALVSYDVVVRVTQGTRVRSDRYSGEAAPGKADMRVNTFSEDEALRPHVPHGITVGYTLGGDISSANQTAGQTTASVAPPTTAITSETSDEVFSIPEVSPLYSFGIRPCIARSTLTTLAPGAPRTIGSLTLTKRRYLIAVAGSETINGQPTIHLTLTPLLDPRADRLRDLWIDARTNRAVQARVAGNFTGPETHVSWLITFASLGGATYIVSETSEGAVRHGASLFDRVEIRFEHVAADSRPESQFAFTLPLDTANLNLLEEPEEPGGRACPA